MGQQGVISGYQPLYSSAPNTAPTFEVLVNRDNNTTGRYVFGCDGEAGFVTFKSASWLSAQGYSSALVSTFSASLDSADASLLGITNGSKLAYDPRFKLVRNLNSSSFLIVPEYSQSTGWGSGQPDGTIAVTTTFGATPNTPTTNGTPTPTTPTIAIPTGVITKKTEVITDVPVAAAPTFTEQITEFFKNYWWLLVVLAALVFLYIQSQGGRGSRRRKRSIF